MSTGREKPMTITEFLEARISEDEEQAARHLKAWANADDEVDNYEWAKTILAPQQRLRHSNEYMAMRIGYGRVLRECAAKRAIIGSRQSCAAMTAKEQEPGVKLVGAGMVQGLDVALKSLAAVYSDHPDYLEEWRP